MSKEEIESYYDEEKKLEKEIGDLWEVGKKSKAKDKRLKEVKFILNNLENEILLKNARRIIVEYKKRYGKIEVEYE